MRVTIEKKTDQLNFEDFLGGVTSVVTVAGVRKGTKEQQYDIEIEGDKRVWRPAVTVLKLLVAAWGDDASEWVGRRARLYGDPEVMFGREKVGGIRVSHLSHIDKPVSASLTETRGKRRMHTVQPLPEDAPSTPAPVARDYDAVLAKARELTDTDALKALWTAEQVGSAPNDVQAAFLARVDEVKAASEEPTDA